MPLTRSFRGNRGQTSQQRPGVPRGARRRGGAKHSRRRCRDRPRSVAGCGERDHGFEALAAATGVPKTSLMRMLGRNGNLLRGQPERHPQRARAAHRRAYRRARRNHTFSSRPGLNESGTTLLILAIDVEALRRRGRPVSEGPGHLAADQREQQAGSARSSRTRRRSQSSGNGDFAPGQAREPPAELARTVYRSAAAARRHRADRCNRRRGRNCSPWHKQRLRIGRGR